MYLGVFDEVYNFEVVDQKVLICVGLSFCFVFFFFRYVLCMFLVLLFQIKDYLIFDYYYIGCVKDVGRNRYC